MTDRELQRAKRLVKEAEKRIPLRKVFVLGIAQATKDGKRFMARMSDGTTVSFGSDSRDTYFDGEDENKRAAWRARHAKNIGRVYSPGWFSSVVLWGG
jgi:hypothetical protein